MDWVRCKCGVWTNYGILCISCSGSLASSEEEEEELLDEPSSPSNSDCENPEEK
jgi:hypothetical protein